MIIILILSILLFGIIPENNSVVEVPPNCEFATESIEISEQIDILENLQFLTITSIPAEAEFNSFDIRSDGLILMQTETPNNSQKMQIHVYSPEGLFLYGYTYVDSGTSVVFWENSNICIYFLRGDIIASFHEDGEFVGIEKVLESRENRQYLSYLEQRHKQTVGTSVYIATKESVFPICLFSHYSKLTQIGPDGVETVIYDVASNYMLKSITVCVLIDLFLVTTLLLIRNRKERNGIAFSGFSPLLK